jgi:aspartyl-tRNA(Asn)/glutamyl-tRNA(Gln) amidotransferase subunit A
MSPPASFAPSARELAQDLREGRRSAAGVVDAALRRIDEIQPTIRAFVEVDAHARDSAASADSVLARKAPSDLVTGIPYAVKDIIAVAGTRMRAGSAVYDVPSPKDAEAVKRLRSVGAILLGRTRLHEIAFGATGVNAFDGGAYNPRDLARVPGGSSSGSAAAVASGICSFALGTDTGGSCRIPAACCGVVGYKPTHGLFPLDGVMPLAKTLDDLGVLASSVDNAWIATAAMLGREPSPLPMRLPRRAGVLSGSRAEEDEIVRGALDAALALLSRDGCELVEVELPWSSDVPRLAARIMFREAYQVHAGQLASGGPSFGPDVRARLDEGSRITDDDYEGALTERTELSQRITELFARVDVLISATVPIAPPLLTEAASRGAMLPRNTRLFNVIGAPAISLPLPGSQLPVGFQVAGRAGTDEDLFAFAQAIEALLG